MKKLHLEKCPGTVGIILLWTIMFILCIFTPLYNFLAGVGIHVIQGEWYRLFSGWLLHLNLLHLAANIIGLYYIGMYLEKVLGSKAFILIGIVAAFLSEMILSISVYSSGSGMIGGSILTFAYIGIILSIFLIPNQYEKIQLNTRSGNGVILYDIIGNIT